MSSVLYYSNYCNHCNNLLRAISSSSVKNDIHFLCIDKRIKKNGITYIQLENGQEILLPPNIIKVPSLLLLNRGNIVVEGKQVNEYILKENNKINNQATLFNGEPLAFSLNEFGSFKSDNFSFLDQSSEDMSAKGNGGIRQMHNYVAIDHDGFIETPPENYKPDKIDTSMSLDQIRMMRDKEIPKPIQRT